MILRYQRRSRYPRVFPSMTGLPLALVPELWTAVQPRLVAAHQQRLQRATRTRAVGAGHPCDLDVRDQVLLPVIWLRHYPTHATVAYLCGIRDSTVSRIIERVLPSLDAASCDPLRLPDPGKQHRRTLDALLHDTPDLLVLIATFAQRVQRPRTHTAADQVDRGTKQQHPLTSHVAVNETTGQMVDVADRIAGPPADITLLAQARLRARLPASGGAGGDMAYGGLAALHPQGFAATPRRKPRGKPRSPDDVASNQAFARRRVVGAHTTRRLRCYQALNQLDRHQRRHHTTRVRAVAGVGNRRLGRRCHN